jgi:hypothetical protein
MQKVALNKQIMQVLKPALFNAKGTIKSEIIAGKSHLYLTSNSLLYLVFRYEGEQLVIVAAAGSKLKESRQEIISFARQNNFKSIRFHTRNPEFLAKAMKGLSFALMEKKLGFFTDEFVFQLEI